LFVLLSRKLILNRLILIKSELKWIDLSLDILTKKWFLTFNIVWIIWIKIAFECIITKIYIFKIKTNLISCKKKTKKPNWIWVILQNN
jgi:hypothetical protein